MKTVETLPCKVREIEHTTIPLSDGTLLAARIWLPEDARANPVPAILEYIPYRKRDNTAARDLRHHPYIAGHGYACCRVDLRGSGESEGLLLDEYLQQELDDGVEVIRWIASQPWCSGKVGMIGISWGGFNGLQIAAMRPKELQAVISICSTDDRYADDIHFMGGCLLGDNLSWASTMFDHNTHPPDPVLVGDKWRDMWMERLKQSGLWLEKWLEHQHRDEYWRHGSVCENYADITCPVMAVSGWADGYTNAVFRLLENLKVPRRGIVGPWSHKYPHEGKPGPAIGFLQECLRWWDRWLKGIENGIDDEAQLYAYLQESLPPATMYEYRPGRWVAEESWPARVPAREIVPLELFFQKNGLSFCPSSSSIYSSSRPASSPPDPLSISSPLSVGLYGGKWCSYLSPPDLPADQRDEEGGSLCFETEALETTIEILGQTRVDLEFSVDQPLAQVAVRLLDVFPDGNISRVSYGLLNLSHRESHSRPKALQPGKKYRVTVALNYAAQQFPAGHRIRVSLSTSYWPLAWPAPKPFTLSVYPENCRLFLPVRAQRAEGEERLIQFKEPEGAAPLKMTVLKEAQGKWDIQRDLVKGITEVQVINDGGLKRHDEIDLEVGFRSEENYTFQGNDYSTLCAQSRWTRLFRREGWEVSTETFTRLTSDEHFFIIEAELHAFEGAEKVYNQSWLKKIARDLV